MNEQKQPLAGFEFPEKHPSVWMKMLNESGINLAGIQRLFAFIANI